MVGDGDRKGQRRYMMDIAYGGEENAPWTNQAFMLAGQPRVRIWKAWTPGQMQGLEMKVDKSFTRM